MYLVNFEVLLMYLVNFEFLVTSTGTKYIIRKAYGYFLSRFNSPCLGPVFFFLPISIPCFNRTTIA